jgi:DNA helicase HerA-like ATPase
MDSKLRLISKTGDEIVLLFSPPGALRIGDCVRVYDGELDIAAQVYDLRFGGLSQAFAEILSSLPDSEAAKVAGLINDAQFSDYRIARCKIRGTIQNGRFVPGLLRLPSKDAKVQCMDEEQVIGMLGLAPKKPAGIGSLYGSSRSLAIDLASLQGVTLVTGRKGSGKSHLAKKILEQIVANGAPAVVLDVNGEYACLRQTDGGKTSSIADRLVELVPGSNFFIPLDGISFETFCRMCQIEENHNAFRLFARYWAENEKGKTLDGLQEWVSESQSPPGSINAAMARINYASSLGVFGNYDFSKDLEKIRVGGAVILNLFSQGEKAKELSIVYVLRQLVSAGLRDRGKVFLFAEEAQNYFEKEFWDDVITRMRHLGIYSVIITNEPTTLPGMVFRQCDNLFSFNFSSDADIAFVSNAQVIDPQSLSVIKNLGTGQCVAVGKCTNGFPLVIQVSPTNAKAGGETKLLWG